MANNASDSVLDSFLISPDTELTKFGMHREDFQLNRTIPNAENSVSAEELIYMDGLYDETRFVNYPGTFKVIPVWEIVVKVIFYVIIILVALLGNLAVVVTIWKKQRLHTTTNYYLVNLAVSDLMVTLSCTWVHLVDDLTENWVLGAFFCRINSFVQSKYIE